MSLPEKNIGEITLIGTGGGYGESIVIHMGERNWVIIDSCVDPITKEPLPLQYLKGIGVDVSSDVKLIICTHWHDDHIRGISTIFEESLQADFCIAPANDVKKFMQLMELDYEKAAIEISNSSTVEYGKCTEIRQSRNSFFIRAGANKNLFSVSLEGGTKSEVFSLSPSDFTMHQFDLEISTLMTEYISAARKMPAGSPNSKSVAVFLKFGVHGAILGADLETTSNSDEGWKSVVEKNTVMDRKSSLFKIPHHGSENGFSGELWSAFLDGETISKLTPYNKNTKLPQPEMLEKYVSLSKELYMTTLVFGEKGKKRDPAVEKMLKNMNYKLKEVKFEQGLIRCRIDLLDSDAKWQVEPLKNAARVYS